MLQAGTLLIDRYRVTGTLARGGMSDVFVARDELLDRDVAIKVMRGDATNRQRFEAEIRLLAPLDHPSLVKVFDVGEVDQQPFVVMELVNGPTLADVMADGPLDDERALALASDLSDSLVYLHDRGIVHRDVKPSNILLDEHGHARLADFGIARLVDTTRLTASGAVMGSPSYVAPEQITGAPCGPPADVYSLGLVLGESVSGERPFDGAGIEVAAARLDRPPDLLRSVPPRWQPLIVAMTNVDPAARPTATEVHEQVVAGLPVADATVAATRVVAPVAVAPTMTLPQSVAPLAVPPRARPKAPASTRDRRAWVLAALAAAAAVLVVAMVLASQGDDGLPTRARAAAATSTSAALVAPTVPTTTTAVPATTTPPPTAAAVVIDCASLERQRANVEAQRKAADRQSKGPGAAGKLAKRALDQQKHDLDDALKACR